MFPKPIKQEIFFEKTVVKEKKYTFAH